ncbi:MAG TPA: GatB/YqeY domain-containing protein [Candidatus Eisenbacteria bacterium]
MTEPSILDRIQSDLAAAMKARDADTLSTLRMLKAALMEEKTRKAKDAGLTADEEVTVVQRYAKKRREVIEEWKKAGRADLVEREEREIAVTQRYLPQGVSEDELRALVLEAVARTGAAGPKDAGKVIGAVMARVKGRAEGGTVSRLVKEALPPG